MTETSQDPEEDCDQLCDEEASESPPDDWTIKFRRWIKCLPSRLVWFAFEPNPWNTAELKELLKWHCDAATAPFPATGDFSEKDFADNAKLIFNYVEARNQHYDKLTEWMLTIPGLITGVIINNFGKSQRTVDVYGVWAIGFFAASIILLLLTRLATRVLFGVDTRILLNDMQAGHPPWFLIARSWHRATRAVSLMIQWKRQRCVCAACLIILGMVLALISFS